MAYISRKERQKRRWIVVALVAGSLGVLHLLSGPKGQEETFDAEDVIRALPDASSDDQACTSLRAMDRISKAGESLSSLNYAVRYGVSTADMRDLTLTARTYILNEYLTRGADRDDGINRELSRVYSTHSWDPAFIGWFAERAMILQDDLQSDRVIRQAKANWTSMTPRQKQQAMERIVSLVSEAFGTPRPTLTFFAERPNTRDLGGGRQQCSALLGYQLGDEISFNLEGVSVSDGVCRNVFQEDFNEVVRILVHETLHHVGDELFERMRQGRLRASEPFQMQLLFLGYNRQYYLSADAHSDQHDHRNYREQPIEQLSLLFDYIYENVPTRAELETVVRRAERQVEARATYQRTLRQAGSLTCRI